MHMGILLDLLT